MSVKKKVESRLLQNNTQKVQDTVKITPQIKNQEYFNLNEKRQSTDTNMEMTKNLDSKATTMKML